MRAGTGKERHKEGAAAFGATSMMARIEPEDRSRTVTVWCPQVRGTLRIATALHLYRGRRVSQIICLTWPVVEAHAVPTTAYGLHRLTAAVCHSNETAT